MSNKCPKQRNINHRQGWSNGQTAHLWFGMLLLRNPLKTCRKLLEVLPIENMENAKPMNSGTGIIILERVISCTFHLGYLVPPWNFISDPSTPWSARWYFCMRLDPHGPTGSVYPADFTLSTCCVPPVFFPPFEMSWDEIGLDIISWYFMNLLNLLYFPPAGFEHW